MVTRLLVSVVLACLLCVRLWHASDLRRSVRYDSARLNSVRYHAGVDHSLRHRVPSIWAPKPVQQVWHKTLQLKGHKGPKHPSKPAQQGRRKTLEPKALLTNVVPFGKELRGRLIKAMRLWPIKPLPARQVPFNTQLPKACVPVPTHKASYVECMRSLYSTYTEAINSSLEQEFASVKECSGLTSEKCAVYLYSTVPLWPSMEQCGKPLAGSTMRELYLMAEVSRMHKSGIECIMLDSIDLNVQILTESTLLARKLYLLMVEEGNPALVNYAESVGMSSRERAELAFDYRNWAKQLLRDDIMRNTFHNDWGTEILYMRDEAKYGSRTGITFDELKVRNCKKLEIDGCDRFDMLPEEQQELVFERIQKSPDTNQIVNRLTQATPSLV